MTADEIEQVQKAIDAPEAERAVLGDEVVDKAVAPLHEKLAALRRLTQPIAAHGGQVLKYNMGDGLLALFGHPFTLVEAWPAAVYGRFSEELDTADLRAAKALLEELS